MKEEGVMVLRERKGMSQFEELHLGKKKKKRKADNRSVERQAAIEKEIDEMQRKG